MPGALVISVGGTPEPVVYTLRETSPEFTCFFVSQQSVDLIGEIKSRVGERFDDLKVLVDDKDDLIACYEKAVECLRRTEERGWKADSIIIDYTGGTKAMTAALAMAAVVRGVRFSYVSGRERDKGGLGRVVTGTELRRIDVSPWQLFAVQERKRIAQYFNAHQYEAAAMILHDVAPHVREEDRRLFDLLARAARGYADWDRFEHGQALAQLAGAKKELELVAVGGDLQEFLSAVSRGVEFLGRLKQKTASYKRPHPLLLADLLANADRRIEEGKHDDAVARFYRALELQGQIAFEGAFGRPTSSVEAERIPESLREEYGSRYLGKDRKLQLPLYAVYRALAERGDEAGRRFMEVRADVEKILDCRNSSILAHGLRPVGGEQAKRLREIVLALLPERPEFPHFPQLPW
jgi:CRISPR-associated protein (TIGR02710 family)